MIWRILCAALTNVSVSGTQWGSRGREFDSRHSDHKIQRFHVRNCWIFFVYGLASFGFDHNFDHNAGEVIWFVAIRLLCKSSIVGWETYYK